MRVKEMIKVSQHRVLISLVLAAFLAACARPGGSTPPPSSRLEQITQAGVLRVGVAADVPPFAWINRQGERQGFDIALMSEIARRMGVQVAWVDAAYGQLPALVQSGKVDVAVGAIPYSEQWDRNVDFTQPYYDLGEPGPADPGLLFIILPQADAALADRLNGMIAQLVGEGFIHRLAQKYIL